MNLSKSVSLTGRAVSATLHSICIGKVSTVWEKVSDNFKNYFFASAFVLLWEFVTDDEGKLVRIWHFFLCYVYLSNYCHFCDVFCLWNVYLPDHDIFVGIFSACVMFTCQMRVGAREVYTVCLSQMHHGGTHQWLKKVHKDVKAHIREDCLHFRFLLCTLNCDFPTWKDYFCPFWG